MAKEDVLKNAKVLVFDSYGTLFDTGSVAAACEELFPGHGTRLGRLWRAKQLEYTWLLSLMGRFVDFWQVTERALAFACRALRLPLADSARKEAMETWLHLPLFPDVRPALDDLAAYRLAVLSNGATWMLGEVLAHAGIERYFARVLSVDEAGVYKPSPRVYQMAPGRMNALSEEVLYVCADPWDLCGAISFGLRACWLNRRGDAWDELGFVPALTVKGLSELAGLVKQPGREGNGRHTA